jgi:hypothetical protein
VAEVSGHVADPPLTNITAQKRPWDEVSDFI